MAYSLDFRLLAVDLVRIEGETQKEVAERLKVGVRYSPNFGSVNKLLFGSFHEVMKGARNEEKKTVQRAPLRKFRPNWIGEFGDGSIDLFELNYPRKALL